MPEDRVVLGECFLETGSSYTDQGDFPTFFASAQREIFFTGDKIYNLTSAKVLKHTQFCNGLPIVE